MTGRGNAWYGRRRVVTLTITVIVLLTLLAACVGTVSAATSASPSPDAGKVTLRLGWSESPLNLNPFIGYSNSYEVWLLNYDTLVAVGADGLPSKETGLAEDWSLSPDEKEWTFKIRPGVKWQDGEPLTARDVAWTFNTIIENDLSLAVYLKDVEKAVAVDDTTLKVYCSAPKANMLLTQVYIYILPEHIWGKLSADQLANTFRNPVPIVGSGPFQTVGVQEGRVRQAGPQPHVLGQAADHRRGDLPVLHEHRHDGAGPQERRRRRRTGDPRDPVLAAARASPASSRSPIRCTTGSTSTSTATRARIRSAIRC